MVSSNPNTPTEKFKLFREVHRYADTDNDADAMHHTIGDGINQAASGRLVRDLIRDVDDHKFTTGDVKMSMSPNTPAGWLELDGQEVERATYVKLFLMLGTAYGAGDGSTTFNLPDFTNRVPRGGGIIGSLGGADGIPITVQSGTGVSVASTDARDRFIRVRFLIKA